MISSSSEILPPVERKGILVLHRSGLPIARKVANANANATSASQKQQQPPVYMFLSGFPDSSSTFDSFAKPFEEHFHVVKMSYPDMDEPCLGSFWGYSLRQVEMALVAVIQDYRCSDTYQCETIFLHGFDWGAVVTLLTVHHYPTIVTKLIQQDVGIMKIEHMSLYNMIVIPSYQIYLAWIFLLSRIITLLLGNDDRLASRLLGFLPLCFPWFLLMTEGPKGGGGGGGGGDNENSVSFQMLPHQCYPYFRVIVDMVTGHWPELQFTPTVPQFFAYGAKKNVSFHSKEYLTQLESSSSSSCTPKCRVKAYSGSHWFHTTHEAEFQNDILDFLQDNE